METWLKLKAFLALYVLICGIGLMFGQSDGVRVVIGALFVSIGLSLVFWIWLGFRAAVHEQSHAKVEGDR